jgi:hypothetical protein
MRAPLATRLGCLTLLPLFALDSPPAAAAAQVGEYELKTAFVFNFINFTRWPAAAGNPLTLCVHGPDTFGAALDRLEGRSVGKRGLAVRRAVGLDGLPGCDAVFISAPAMGNLAGLLDRLSGRPVLTIADSPGAMRRGVLINMIRTEQNKIGFEVNLAAARENGLDFSAQMLSLAVEVRN